MKMLILIVVLEFKYCLGTNGFIWDKNHKKFVPIFNVKEFIVVRDKILNKNDLSQRQRSFKNLTDHHKIQNLNRQDVFDEYQQKEIHNFNGQEIHFIYYDDHDIFQFYDNNSKATGILGDMWTILSEYMNFTMIVHRTTAHLGSVIDNSTKFTGLLGLLQEKKYTIIPKVEAYSVRLEAVDFSRSIWKNNHRLFIKPSYHFKGTWMLDIFSGKIWGLTVIFYLLLSTFSILALKLGIKGKSIRYVTSKTDHFFYVFGALCNQGEMIYLAQRNHKVLSLSISIFSWLLITSFSSQLFIYMSQTVLIPPFDSLETLLFHTDYTILAERYSIVDISFRKNYRPIYKLINDVKRIKYYTKYDQMWNLACSEYKNYAVLQSESLRMDNFSNCQLDAVGEDYFSTYIVSGIVKGFPHKRSFDLGILKLHEFGIINALKARWLKSKYLKPKADRFYSPLTMDQITLIIGVYISGVLIAVVLLAAEKIIIWRKIGSQKSFVNEKFS